MGWAQRHNSVPVAVRSAALGVRGCVLHCGGALRHLLPLVLRMIAILAHARIARVCATNSYRPTCSVPSPKRVGSLGVVVIMPAGVIDGSDAFGGLKLCSPHVLHNVLCCKNASLVFRTRACSFRFASFGIIPNVALHEGRANLRNMCAAGGCAAAGHVAQIWHGCHRFATTPGKMMPVSQMSVLMESGNGRYMSAFWQRLEST